MAGALRFEEFGRMFSVQAYGSLVYRCLLPGWHLECPCTFAVLGEVGAPAERCTGQPTVPA